MYIYEDLSSPERFMAFETRMEALKECKEDIIAQNNHAADQWRSRWDNGEGCSEADLCDFVEGYQNCDQRIVHISKIVECLHDLLRYDRDSEEIDDICHLLCDIAQYT